MSTAPAPAPGSNKSASRSPKSPVATGQGHSPQQQQQQPPPGEHAHQQGSSAPEHASPQDDDEQGDDENDSALGDNQNDFGSTTASLTESIREYRSIHGRTFQTSKTTEYWGPNDEEQNEGLDIAHQLVTMLKGDRLFEAPIENPGRVLDVATGTGIWAIDMADEYPAAEVIGNDISPIQPEWVPPNCRFEIDDVQLDWTYEPGSFDFIHMRMLYGSIGDWPRLYGQAFRALRPGGWIEDFEVTITLESDLPEVRDDPHHIFKQWGDVFIEAMDRVNKTARIGLDGNMRKYMDQVGFVNVVEKNYRLPCGGWPRDPVLKRIGLYNLAFMDNSLEGFALFLLQEVMGWEYAAIQVFVAKMRQAIRDPKIRPFYNVVTVYARKPETETPEA